ncbi:MAG: MarR family winged helix-turn-helix transcriptional regulator [Acidimicrobiia bacterium]
MSADRPADLAGKVAAALDRLAHARRAERQAVATRHGLTPLQADLLAVLRGGPPPEPLVGALAAEVGVTQPTVTDSLRALEGKGLVRRRPDPRDGRRATVELTVAGTHLAAELADTPDAVVEAVRGLDRAQQEAALEALLALIARLVDVGAITVARTCATCRFHRFERGVHRCTLLDVELPPAELRVDCPEHQPA